jgi:hypothetical protein
MTIARARVTFCVEHTENSDQKIVYRGRRSRDRKLTSDAIGDPPQPTKTLTTVHEPYVQENYNNAVPLCVTHDGHQ